MIIEIILTSLIIIYLVLFLALSIINKSQIFLIKSKKPIDLIIPVYNEEKIIKKCLNNVVSQGKILRRIIIVLKNIKILISS